VLVKRLHDTEDVAPLTATLVHTSNSDRVDVAGVIGLHIFTKELRRTLEFYSRLFGLRLLEDSHRGAERYVVMGIGQSLRITVQERDKSACDSIQPTRFTLVADDFDRARASVWNLGVRAIELGGETSLFRPRRRNRSFVIRDPGGNEIEIVERSVDEVRHLQGERARSYG
jgi:catechol 2,3-dioxygenase-like lactoylglutathione lyase family enzyme